MGYNSPVYGGSPPAGGVSDPVTALERAVPVDGLQDGQPALQTMLNGLRDIQFGDPSTLPPGVRSVGNLPHAIIPLASPLVVPGTTKVIGKNCIPYPTPEDAYASGPDAYGYRANTEAGTTFRATADFSGGDDVLVIEPDNAFVDGIKVDLSLLPRGTGVPEWRVTNKYGRQTELKQVAVVWNPESTLWTEVLGTSDLVMLSTSLPPGQMGKPYEHCLSAANGDTGIHVWTYGGDPLPAGFTTTAEGVIKSANVTEPWSGNVEVTVTDGVQVRTRTLRLEMRSASITDDKLYPAMAGFAHVPQQLEFESVSGTSNLETTWKYAPPGMSLSLTGEISGTPDADAGGAYYPVVTLTDTVHNTVYEQEFELIVYTTADSLFIDNKQIVDKNVSMGEPISEVFRAHGGTPPYTWDIDVAETATFTGSFANNQVGYPTATQNCEGMTVASGGGYTGTPTLVGGGTTLPAAPNNNQVAGFVIRVTDSLGATAGQYVEFYLRNPGSKTTLWNSRWLPQMTVGTPVTYDLELPAEDAPYTVESLQMPTGLTVTEISPTLYRLSGTPAPYKEINGIRTSWGSKVINCTVINAPGAGIVGGAFSSSNSNENLKQVERCIIRNCFVNMAFARGSFDNRVDRVYSAGGLYGFLMGSGCSANTVNRARLEFSAIHNLVLRGAHENSIGQMLLDTAGESAVVCEFSNYNNFNSLQFYRPGRLEETGGPPRNTNADPQYSCAMRIVGGKNNRVSNCAVIPGHNVEGVTGQSGVSGKDRNFVRPTTGIYLDKTTDTTIVANDLAGVSGKSIVTFGDNPGLKISENQYSDRNLKAWDKSAYPPLPYTLTINGNYQSASQGDDFTVVPAGTGVFVPTIDGWSFFSEGPDSTDAVTQNIRVQRIAVSNDSRLPFRHYARITKPAEPGAVPGQLQACFHINRTYTGEDLRKLSQRSLIFSYYVRSNNSTRVTPIVKGVIGGTDYFQIFHTQQFPTTLFKRRYHTHDFGDLRGITIVDGDYLELAFLFSDATKDVDVEISGHLMQGLQEADYYPGAVDDMDAADVVRVLGLDTGDGGIGDLPLEQFLVTGNPSLEDDRYFGSNFANGFDNLDIYAPGNSPGRIRMHARRFDGPGYSTVEAMVLDSDTVVFPRLGDPAQTNGDEPQNYLIVNSAGRLIYKERSPIINFNVGDWTASEYTVPKSTHQKGGQPVVQVRKLVGGDFVDVVPGGPEGLQISCPQFGVGLLKLTVTPGQEFQGMVIFTT